VSLSRCALLGVALALAACSTTGTTTAPEQPVASLADRLKGAGEAQAACYAGLRADPSTTRVVAYTVVGADDAALARKTRDRRKVSDEMLRDLVQVRRATEACRALARERFAAIDPAYVEVLALTQEAEDSILLGMLNRRLRVGEANRRFLDVDKLSDAAFAATTASLTPRADDAPAAAALRKEAAAAAVRRLAEERRALERLREARTAGACRFAGTEVDCGLV
jgi:hypothetical protein